MCGTSRRDFLGRLTVGGLTLTPLALALSACGKSEWPEGMAEIKWDRETCPRCSMAISDRRFAAQLRGGPKDMVVKFDDIGCAVFWMRDKQKDYPWLMDVATRFWVADVGGTGETMQAGKTGLLVPPRDVEALAQAMRTLAENPDRRAAMGAAGPEWIRRSFTLDDMVRRVSDVDEKAVAAYRARSGRQ